MKGIEGLPLKYIVIILVAALVIGVVYTIMTMFTATATAGAGVVGGTVSAGINQTARHACEAVAGCTFNVTTQECICV